MGPDVSGRYIQLVHEARSRIRELPPGQIELMRLELGVRLRIVDIRDERDWRVERIPGAVRIGKDLIERDERERLSLQTGQMVIYSASGIRSILVADTLLKLGYKNVVSIVGGFNAWRALGLPTETGEPPKFFQLRKA